MTPEMEQNVHTAAWRLCPQKHLHGNMNAWEDSCTYCRGIADEMRELVTPLLEEAARLRRSRTEAMLR